MAGSLLLLVVVLLLLLVALSRVCLSVCTVST